MAWLTLLMYLTSGMSRNYPYFITVYTLEFRPPSNILDQAPCTLLLGYQSLLRMFHYPTRRSQQVVLQLWDHHPTVTAILTLLRTVSANSCAANCWAGRCLRDVTVVMGISIELASNVTCEIGSYFFILISSGLSIRALAVCFTLWKLSNINLVGQCNLTGMQKW